MDLRYVICTHGMFYQLTFCIVAYKLPHIFIAVDILVDSETTVSKPIETGNHLGKASSKLKGNAHLNKNAFQ